MAKCYYSDFRVSLKSGNFLNTWTTISFSRTAPWSWFPGCIKFNENFMQRLSTISLCHFLMCYRYPGNPHAASTVRPKTLHDPAATVHTNQPTLAASSKHCTHFLREHQVHHLISCTKWKVTQRTWDVAAFRLVISYVVFEWEIFCIMLVYY